MALTLEDLKKAKSKTPKEKNVIGKPLKSSKRDAEGPSPTGLTQFPWTEPNSQLPRIHRENIDSQDGASFGLAGYLKDLVRLNRRRKNLGKSFSLLSPLKLKSSPDSSRKK